MKWLGCVVLGVFLLSCGGTKRPALYPNDYLESVGGAQAERDIDECLNKADQYVKSDAAKEAAKSTAAGGAAGAVIGAAGGAVRGGAGTGAAVGAATGAAAGLVRGVFKGSQPSPLFVNFVNKCLREKGYEIIGWH